MKYLLSFVGAILYVIIFIITYCLWINYFRVDVVFYSTLYAAGVSLLFYGMSLAFIPIFSKLNRYEKFNAVLVAALLGYVISISIPTVIDRSLSFYILEKLQQRGGAIRLDKFNYIFTDEYMREHQLVDIRLTEQESSGTIFIESGCVRLTHKGAMLADFSRYFRKNFLPKKRLLRGEYTDKLIDPFSRSDTTPGYICE